MHYRIRPEAKRELRDAARWYEEQEQGLGLELLARFNEKLAFALESPGAGTLEGTTTQGAEVRSFRLARFRRYAILIAAIDGVPTVLAFKHSSRRPGYWKARLGR
jgi:plasmid stabilization system protein ParE